jgi:photosystem II stability/assembly factor-like uncharacterized protein
VKRSLLLAIGVLACARGAPLVTPATLTLESQVSGTTTLLQAVSVVNDSVVWASGHRGTWARTLDGGRTWMPSVLPGADSLQFRDVHAVSADTAWLLAAGPGERSRIYFTADGGRSWTLQFLNGDSAAFFDCFAFWDARRGVAVSDAVQGRLVVLRTDDGGARWEPVPAERIPAAHPGEGAFAASGTCVLARGAGTAWIATAAAAGSRVYRSDDGGWTWRAAEVPVARGEATGIATIAMRDARHGLALGGPVADPAGRVENAARTDDGGRSWRPAPGPPFTGAVFGAAWLPGTTALVAVGPRGLAWSRDSGMTWARLSEEPFWAVAFGRGRVGWAVGPGGRIVRLSADGR